MTHGAVYLLQDIDTGEYRLGASCAPRSRILDHRRSGRHLLLVWTIRSNDCFRLEAYLLTAWKPWAAGRDWFRLPAEQVRWFCAVGAVDYHNKPPVRQFLRGDEVTDGHHHPAYPNDGRPRRYVVRHGSMVG